jgi:hypothetical protein
VTFCVVVKLAGAEIGSKPPGPGTDLKPRPSDKNC